MSPMDTNMVSGHISFVWSEEPSFVLEMDEIVGLNSAQQEGEDVER